MVEHEIAAKMASAFGFQYFITTIPSLATQDKPINEQDKILSLWRARVSYFHSPMYIAVARSDTWHRGAIVIPRSSSWTKEADIEYMGPDPLHAVDLEDWEDPVEAALHTIDLYDTEGHSGVGLGSYRYDLFIETMDSSGSISVSGGINRSPTLKNLWLSLLLAIYHLVELYDDDEMREFVNYKPKWIYFRPDTPPP
jgi:hypothetical protein